jgi:GAF domain-containing protein
LIELAREMDGALRLPEFARRFVSRTAELTGARAGLLAVMQEGRWQVAALQAREPSAGKTTSGLVNSKPLPPESPLPQRHPDFKVDQGLERALDSMLKDFSGQQSETLVSGSAEQILGMEAASRLRWTDCTLVRLRGADGQLSGLLCLSGLPTPLDAEDRIFLETMAGHAAMALENARLFTRIEQANRHWMEIFDAITDFIVVHDHADRVLRVNRSLAAMIGVPPAELIGVNMRALMALTRQRHTPARSAGQWRTIPTNSRTRSSIAPTWFQPQGCMERRTKGCKPSTC